MKDEPKDPRYHSLLPVEAQKIPKRAASTPITRSDPLARRKAIDTAIGKVRRMWPQYFKQEV